MSGRTVLEVGPGWIEPTRHWRGTPARYLLVDERERFLGAVPCEGGLAWGLGRVLTSRRYVRKTMAFDYDKIICWEHPQFVDTIKALLEGTFQTCRSIRRPLGCLPLDFNLSWSFVFRKT